MPQQLISTNLVQNGIVVAILDQTSLRAGDAQSGLIHGGHRLDRVAPKPQLLALTGARFFAAAHVMLFHILIVCFFVVTNPEAETPALLAWRAAGVDAINRLPWLRSLLMTGFSAVSFFFTLSGFILTYTCLDESGKATVNPRSFWVARFARIYPVYVFGLLINLPAFLVWLGSRQPPLSGAQGAAVAASAVTLLQSWWPKAAAAWNGPGWSLSVEAFFYAAFPWIIARIDRLRPGNLVLLGIGCYALAVALPSGYLWLDPDRLGQVMLTSDAFWLDVVKFNPLMRLPEFMAGMVVGKLFGRQIAQDAAAASGPGWLAPLAGAALVAVFSAAGERISPLLLYNGLLMPLYVLLIYGLARGRGPLEWLLSRRLFVRLGDASYGLYILHFAVVLYGFVGVSLALGGMEQIERSKPGGGPAARNVVLMDGSPRRTMPADATTADASAAQKPQNRSVPSPIVFLLLISGVAIGLSLVTHKLIEVPCRRYLRRLGTRKQDRGLEPVL